MFLKTLSSFPRPPQGAQNQLRNNAVNMGGNYVQLITNRSSYSSDGSKYGGEHQTGVMTIGNVYRCPR